MPVSGLVVTLSEDDGFQQETIDAIVAEPRLEIGYIRGQRMAVVMDTRSAVEDKELWAWLTALPGVLFVDVTLIGFEGDDSDSASDTTAKAVADRHASAALDGNGSETSQSGLPPSQASPASVSPLDAKDSDAKDSDAKDPDLKDSAARDSEANDRASADILLEDSQDVAPTEAVSVPFPSHKPTRSQE